MKEHFGYTEPFRRFVQRESFSPQANEIPNTMPSWLPGDDYLTNFHVGDPYVRIDEGYARLPGAGYEALHPDVRPGLSVLEEPKTLARTRGRAVCPGLHSGGSFGTPWATGRRSFRLDSFLALA